LLRMGIDGFYSPLEDSAFEHHLALASEALYAYIGAEPDHFPPVAAAGMLFFEADYITEFYIQDHRFL